jgi:hypothetical protein
VHVRAFVFDFLFTFGHMVRDWSERTARDLEEWAHLDLDQRRELAKARIARALAERPERSPTSVAEAQRLPAAHAAPASRPPRSNGRAARPKRAPARRR